MRVTYGEGYLLGTIEDLVAEKQSYKVEQRETKTQVVLRSGVQRIKTFKLTQISDKSPTENELKKYQIQNIRQPIDKDFIKK